MTISFDSGQHEVLIERLRAATLSTKRELDELAAAVSDVRGGWSGAAQEAYDRAQSRWTIIMKAMHAILQQADDAAEVAGSTYGRPKQRRRGSGVDSNPLAL
jgi:WXG100 family type VII secretion target